MTEQLGFAFPVESVNWWSIGGPGDPIEQRIARGRCPNNCGELVWDRRMDIAGLWCNACDFVAIGVPKGARIVFEYVAGEDEA